MELIQAIKNAWGLSFGNVEETQRRMTEQRRLALRQEVGPLPEGVEWSELPTEREITVCERGL